MLESEEIRQRLAADGFSTSPGTTPDEFRVEGAAGDRTALLLLNEGALVAYLESIESDAVAAYGRGSDPRRSARNLVALNIIEALETRIVHRIGVGSSGWIEDTERLPDPLNEISTESADLEWSAHPGSREDG